MKNVKNCRGFALIFLIILVSSVSHSFYTQFRLNREPLFAYEKVNTPKISGSWALAPLHIDDAGGGDYTWAEAAAQAWCSGNGSLINPYRLENITIDAGWSATGILIENSNNKFFIIRNCTVTNSGGTIDNNAGIKLLSTSNGTVENNKCLNNIKTGIYVQSNSNYNTIQNNYVTNSSLVGIRIYQSTHNKIMHNTITEGSPIFSEGILIDSSSSLNVVFNNTITTQVYGIEVIYSAHNNTIVNNDINNIVWDGISVRVDSNNNTIKMNKINGTFVGILLEGNVNGSMVYGNILTNNGENGEDGGKYNRWDNGTLGNFWDDYGGSDLTDDGIGDTPYNVPGSTGSQDNYPLWDDGLEPIYIDGAATGVGAHNWTWAENQPWCTGLGTLISPYVIKEISRDGRGNGFCISVQNSDVYFEIRNCSLYNAGFIDPDSGIILNNVGNATIIGNDLFDMNFIGISMDNSDNNNIIGNNASFADLGILMVDSKYNHIIGNTISDTVENAINIETSSHNNTISGNTANRNQLGISIFDNSDNNTVIGNTVMNNAWAGILLMSQSDSNIVLNNEISDNNIGVTIPTSDCHLNTIYNNTFTLNTLNAEDDSINNTWNYGIFGNYWDNYTGFDLDDDGIGDKPYNVSGLAGSKDYYPIWDDGDDIYPTITLNSPLGGTTFGTDAPEFNLTIYDLNLHESWYTIASSVTPHSFTPTNGINLIPIDDISWDALPEGSVTINFFVNDTVGNVRTIQVIVNKELPSSGPGQAIPYGNYYIIFLGIGIISLLLVEYKKMKKKVA